LRLEVWQLLESLPAERFRRTLIRRAILARDLETLQRIRQLAITYLDEHGKE
jgi:hypothetical protein